jgi:hypothetical protein
MKSIYKSFWMRHIHMRCTTNMLNLMVQDDVKIIQPALNQIEELMHHITSSGLGFIFLIPS